MSDTRTGAPNRNAGKEQVSATAMGEAGTVIDANNRKSSSVTVVRLVQVQTGGSEEVTGPKCELNARAEVMTDRYTFSGTPIPGMFGASVTYSATQDTRSLRIGSSIEPSYTKSDDGSLPSERYRSVKPLTGPYSVLIDTASGQYLHDAESIVSEKSSATPGGPKRWVAKATFWPNLDGAWIGPMTYDWNPKEDAEPGSPTNSSDFRIEHDFGEVYGPAEKGFPLSSTVRLKVKDMSDAATAEDDYRILWHLPAERAQLDHLGNESVKWAAKETDMPVGGVPHNAGYDIKITEVAQTNQVVIRNFGAYTFTFVSAAAAIGSIPATGGGAVGVMVASTVLTAIGYHVQEMIPEPNPKYRTERNSYDMWSRSVQEARKTAGPGLDARPALIFPAEELPRINLGSAANDPHWMSSTLESIYYKHTLKDWHMKYDEYDSHGYVGINTAVAPKEVAAAEAFGVYQTAYRTGETP